MESWRLSRKCITRAHDARTPRRLGVLGTPIYTTNVFKEFEGLRRAGGASQSRDYTQTQTSNPTSSGNGKTNWARDVSAHPRVHPCESRHRRQTALMAIATCRFYLLVRWLHVQEQVLCKSFRHGCTTRTSGPSFTVSEVIQAWFAMFY